MKQLESTLKTLDGVQLFQQAWIPDSEPRGLVCLIHGLGEHSGRYLHVAQFLTSQNYAVYAMDNRGHGKSSGERGHVNDFEDFMKDIDQLMQKAQEDYPGIPIFLYGHSLGGILVLNYALRRKPSINGVVATSPGLRTVLEEQKIKIALSKLISSILPKLSMPTGLQANQISHDPQVVKKYTEDPLVHDRGTPGLAVNLLEAIEWAYQHAHEFSVPLLLMHGTDDEIAYARGSQEFASKVRGDCTLKLWEGMAHETHNEPDKDQVLAYLADWLATKL
ncbi:MAG TPA: lysophospholipase [Anaerolineales bacterium]|nr:lysophospholipase [Anaerolineales bacterium]